ncbi:DUF3060 domain-containing protein [Mycobacterium sp. LTG2003]
MDPQEDPEARIRELERPLADVARASELGTGPDAGNVSPTQPWTHGTPFPPPPPGPPAPWPGYADQFPAPPPPHNGSGARILVVLGLIMVSLFAAGIAAYVMFSGGGTGSDETAAPPNPTVQAPVIAPPRVTTESTTVTAPGETVIVSGINENRTVACNGNAVIVSGIENTLTITGHCANVAVSGIQNTITVDSADSIGVSGFENRVTFHTGQPEISKSGQDNSVEQG